MVAMDKEYDLLHNMLNIKEVALDEKKENERYIIGTSKSCDDICVMLTKCGIDMESGSIAQTCYRYNLPFVGIRIVSDCPLCPECASYDDFWKNAPDTLNKVVCAFFDFIKETQL